MENRIAYGSSYFTQNRKNSEKISLNRKKNYCMSLDTPLSLYMCFLSLAVVYTPYFPHVLEYWNNRDNPNLLVVHFEEMKKDPETVVQKISNFLGKDLTYDEVCIE